MDCGGEGSLPVVLGGRGFSAAEFGGRGSGSFWKLTVLTHGCAIFVVSINKKVLYGMLCGTEWRLGFWEKDMS